MAKVFEQKIPHLSLSFHDTSYIESHKQKFGMWINIKFSFSNVPIKQLVHIF
jgi:hypothetical protein